MRSCQSEAVRLVRWEQRGFPWCQGVHAEVILGRCVTWWISMAAAILAGVSVSL
jgi:hypothetical protein